MKFRLKRFTGVLCAAMIASAFAPAAALSEIPASVDAATTIDEEAVYDDGQSITLYGRTIGIYDEKGQIRFVPQADSHYNATAFQALFGLNTEAKTVIIPKGETIRLATNIIIKSNKTILANGATIIEEGTGQIFKNECEWDPYDCLSNVTIKGGTWKFSDSTVTHSVFAFAHANHVSVKNVTVYTNYQGHGVSFIACKDCELIDSKVLAINDSTKVYHGKEEAVQLDIATSMSAPFVAQFGEQYVKGQCNKNILIKGCTIRGGRGLSTCWRKNTEFDKKLHSNITIENCNITGVSGEAVTIYNCKNYTLKNNCIQVNSSKYLDKKDFYSNGISIMIAGKTTAAKNSRNVLSGNTVKGYFHGIYLNSAKKAKHGTIILKNNKAYATKKADAIVITKYANAKYSGNKTYKR